MDTISYKLETFEGPLDLLVSLVEKNKLNIEDIPIDILCAQYMDYMDRAAEANVELACDFLYMASELMLIKSRMLLPRDPEKDEDPRKPLVDAIIEYQKTKMAAAELADLYARFGSRMAKETDDISPDRTFVRDQSTELLMQALSRVLKEADLSEKTLHKDFDVIMNAPRIPVQDVIRDLVRDLKSGEVYLDTYFRSSANRQEVIAKFISILELLKSHTVAVEETEESETGVTDVATHLKIILLKEDFEVTDEELESY